MSRTFDLGEGAAVDVDRLVKTRLLVQGNSGAGKSWLLRRILEKTFGMLQHVVLDPEGEFATLRERFDYVYVSADGAGDAAAHPRSAALLAERLLELRASAIIALDELEPADRVLFVRRFLEALVESPRALWHPVLVVLDEAQTFCPEKGHGEAQSAEAVISLASRGRKRGFCAVFATQRLSKFNKDAAAECNNKLIGRTALDGDMKRAGDELGMDAKARRELRELADGEWFAYGPALSKTVRRVKVGPVLTTHPSSGDGHVFVPPPPTEKIRALLPKLADLPAEADERARSLEDLKAEIRTLKGALSATTKEAVRVEVPVPLVPPREDMNRFQSGLVELRDVGRFLVDAEERWRNLLGAAETTARRLAGGPRPAPAPAAARPGAPRRVALETNRAVRETDGALTGPERRILDALAWLESLGVEEPEATAAAFLARYKASGGAFNNPKATLKRKGLLTYLGGDRLALTDAGRAAAERPDVALTDEELHRRVLGRLTGPEGKLLRELLAAWPEPMSNAALAAATGYSPDGGAFTNPRGRLKTLGLVEYPTSGFSRARDILFPEAAGR